MSELRRRIFGVGTPDSTPSTSRDASPAPGASDTRDYKVLPAKEVDKLVKKKTKTWGIKRRNAWIFGLGALLGVFLAGFFASDAGGLDRLVEFAGLQEMNLDGIFDVLPSGLIREVSELQVGDLHP